MDSAESSLVRHPDRLLPADPTERAIARELYEAVHDLPLVSPHGHVDPQMLLDDEPFSDPATLFVTPDHYVTRLMHADGVSLDELGLGEEPLSEPAARQVWRHLCERWHLYAGTPVRYWLEEAFATVFEVDRTPSAANADDLYDHLAERLTRPEFRPRALFDRFRISVLATTDDPCSDLAAHEALASDPSWTGRVIPTFRPDRYLEPERPGWPDDVRRLGETADVEVDDYAGYIEALEERRRYFIAHGATSADHSHIDVRTDQLDPDEAANVYRRALAGEATEAEAVAFRRHMLAEMARMSCDDGLVMTLHPGIRRNHHTATSDRFGADTGHDIPVSMEFTESLRPVLERFGTHPDFHLVVFTVDETVWSRELAPLAGFYPSVYLGVPWWFLDAPEAMRRFRDAVTETAGFSRTSGFIDDTRAFCSIPARHDMARRIDVGFLARLVAEHRLSDDEAHRIATSLAGDQAARVFKL